MSTVKTNNLQIGQSATATNNFTLYQPSTPDGTVRLGVGNAGATTAELISFSSSGLFAFNSGYGSVATVYGCRAWVNFNGTGVVAIRASGNVSSITDGGVGIYTVNYTTAMPDTNYAAVVNASRAATDFTVFSSRGSVTQTTAGVTLVTGTTAFALADADNIYVAIFR